eukprot:TRINITY_DN2030_c5_g1_i5.p1 TRINITY_DN2030_c5_g1~~TRINITY_DN2030_c5_g1_i5.p1  ORF type:complete len:407 (-),score=29.22 TRINITY_DN2030_c5_g1_i5:420-1640(-)
MWLVFLLIVSGCRLLRTQLTQTLHPVCEYPPSSINLPSPFFPVKEILGGDYSTTANFPFIVSLQIYYEDLGIHSHFCGGVLLAPDIVLTVAHCIQSVVSGPRSIGKVKSNLREGVFAALNPYCRHQAGEQGRIGLQDYIIHENYVWFAYFSSDIALVRLKSGFDYNGPYPTLQTNANMLVGRKAVVAGWGFTSKQEAGDNDLFLTTATYMRQALLNYVPERECRADLFDAYGFDIYQDTMLCFKSPVNDTCKGDSGGPLIIYDFDFSVGEFIWRLYGLTSLRLQQDCDTGGLVGFYVNIAKFHNWILSNLEILSNTLPPKNLTFSFPQVTVPPSSTPQLQSLPRSIDIGVAGCVVVPQFLDLNYELCDNETVAFYYNSDERQCEDYTTCLTPLFLTLQDCQTTCEP